MVNRATASQVRDAVVEAIDPIQIVLFGSVARQSSGNDLDLLIVVEDGDGGAGSARARKLRSVLGSFREKFDMDDFVLTRSQFVDSYRRGSIFLAMIVSEGLCIYSKEGVETWVRHAQEDLESAEQLRRSGLYRGACYFAQQCVEKSIKAMLLHRGWELEKIHNIRRLLSIVRDLRLPSPLPLDDADFMDDVYRGRYPTESGRVPLGEPTREEADRALRAATQTLGAMRTLLADDDG